MFVSVNAIRPQRKARTRDAIGEIRHVFLDADRDGPAVLAAIAARRDLPPPSYVLHSSPNRLHVLWRVSGFTKEGVEALQKQLARELGTDKAATSCAQITRLPGFFNHKYRPGTERDGRVRCPGGDGSGPRDFPVAVAAVDSQRSSTSLAAAEPRSTADVRERARRYLAAIPPAVAGNHGDATTFRVCCRLVRGFALDDEDALDVLERLEPRLHAAVVGERTASEASAARRYGREPVGGLLRNRLSKVQTAH